MKRAWRNFWAQRSRWRVVLAAVSIIAALIAVGLVYVPGAWLAQMGAAIQAVGAYLVSFGARAWLFAVGGAFFVSAVLLIVLPRRRPHSYWVERPSAIAPVSVYVDAENQLQNAQLVRPFVRYLRTYLREHLQDQRADLLYFANAMQPQTRATYKELYRFGFRPVDVPHAPFEDEEIKDAVDMELSLHAFDRALRGPERQVFIIVTGDRDFLPLVFRLHALGHTVYIWAKQPPETFRLVESFLDNVRYVSLREIFPPDHQPDADNTKQEWTEEATVRVSDEPVSIRQALSITMNILEGSAAKINGAPNPKLYFRQLLGGAHSNFLRQLGFDRGERVVAWIAALSALDVLHPRAPGKAPSRGMADLEVAAEHIEQFLKRLVAVLVELASQHPDGITSYAAVAQAAHARTHAGEPAELRRLWAMLAPSTSGWQAHTGYFCRLARSVNLVEFDEITPSGSIQVKLPVSATFTAPEATPGADEPRESGLDGGYDAPSGEEAEV